MAFNLNLWKQQAGEQVRQIKQWLSQRIRQEAPYLAYGALCGAALWPLVEAMQAGDALLVAAALFTVAGNVGGNLIAEQVSQWKSRADVTDWVLEHASEEGVRQALEQVLTATDAQRQAEAALSDADRAWFQEQLRVERAQLGPTQHNTATVIGGGAIAQGTGNTALGQGASIYHGDVTIVHQYPQRDAPGSALAPPRATRPGAESPIPRQTAAQVREFVQQNQLEAALRLLLALPACEDEASLLMSQLVDCNRQERMGLLESEQARVKRARIASSLLQMCRE